MKIKDGDYVVIINEKCSSCGGSIRSVGVVNKNIIDLINPKKWF